VTTLISTENLAVYAARYSKPVLLLIALVILFSVISQALVLKKHLDEIEHQSLTNDAIEAVPQSSSAYALGNILSANLFGKKVAKKIENIQPKDIPETALNLTLRGTFAKTEPTQGSALIEGSNKQAKHYKVGDSLEGNTVVDAVYSDRVILRRNGRQETLLFPELSSGSSKQSFSSTNASNNKISARTRTPTPSRATNSKPDQKESIRQRLDQLRKKLRNSQN